MAYFAAAPARTFVIEHGREVSPRLEAKDPDDVAPYRFAWGDWLDCEGTTLASFTVTVDTADVTQSEPASSDAAPLADPPTTARNVCVWLAGGTHGKDYLVRCRAVTAAGHTLDRSFWLPVRHR